MTCKHIGSVPFEFMPIDMEVTSAHGQWAHYNSRNNRLLWHCFKQIEVELKTWLQQHPTSKLGIAIGTSTSGILEAENAYKAEAQQKGWPADYHYRQQELASPSEFLNQLLNSHGPSLTISTACSSSAKAFGVAQRWLEQNLCDRVLVGGCDTLCYMTLLGFHSLGAYAKSRCNPFSPNRDGIHIGEAAALFCLSKVPSNLKLRGCGESTDAHHISAPDPSGKGAVKAMQMALDAANCLPKDIDYINLHGTGTTLNDSMEALAIAQCFPNQLVKASSTKALTGHTLGAAGAIEAAICLTSLTHSEPLYPYHHHDGQYSEEFKHLDLISNSSETSRAPKLVMSNSFAFGGSNCSLIFEHIAS